MKKLSTALLFLIIAACVLTGSSFVAPVLIIQAKTHHFGVRPNNAWTKPLLNGKFSGLSVYDMKRCVAGVPRLSDSLKMEVFDLLRSWLDFLMGLCFIIFIIYNCPFTVFKNVVSLG